MIIYNKLLLKDQPPFGTAILLDDKSINMKAYHNR